MTTRRWGRRARVALGAFTLASATAALPGRATEAQPRPAPSSDAKGRATDDPARAVVEALYRRVACETHAATAVCRPGEALLEWPATEFHRFFTPPLARALADDQRCVARTGEVCRLNFSPAWDAQDAEGLRAQVHASRRLDPRRAVVRVTLAGNGKTWALEHRLTRSNTTWRIDEMARPGGWSLRGLLALPARPRP